MGQVRFLLYRPVVNVDRPSASNHRDQNEAACSAKPATLLVAAHGSVTSRLSRARLQFVQTQRLLSCSESEFQTQRLLDYPSRVLPSPPCYFFVAFTTKYGHDGILACTMIHDPIPSLCSLVNGMLYTILVRGHMWQWHALSRKMIYGHTLVFFMVSINNYNRY
jgi:hypothetical protein